MIELKIKNKWISLGGSSYITDMNDNPVYTVKGKIFTFTAKKFLQDNNGNILYQIRNKFWQFFVRRAFVYDAQENLVCTVKKKFFAINSKFSLEGYKDDIRINSNVLDFDYHILKNGKEIGHLARKISLRDSFVLTVWEEADAPFLCALVIAIDNILDKRDSDAAVSSSYSFGN